MAGDQFYLFSSHGDKKLSARRCSINLPLDTLILLGVVVVLLLTIAFSLGVERGRKTAAAGPALSLTPKPQVSVSDEPNETHTFSLVLPPSEDSQAEPQTPSSTANPLSALNDDAEEKYLIQVASYKREDIARREAKKLQDKGYRVRVAKKGKFVVIYVGGFDDKNLANQKMKALRKRFKDCFIRTIRNT